MNKHQLLAQQAELSSACQAHLASLQAMAKTSVPSDDDWKPYNAAKQELEAVSAKLKGLEKLEAEVLANQQATGEARRPVIEDLGDRRADRPWGSLGEYMSAVVQAGMPNGAVDPRLHKFAPSGASNTVPADGGYLVGTDFSSELMRLSYEKSSLAQRCKRSTVSDAAGKWSSVIVDETSRATGSRYGGVQAYWVNEADALTATKPKFGRFELDLQKLACLAYATEENIADAAQLQSVFQDAFTEEMAWTLDNAILRGTGVGQPHGILNHPSLVTVTKESSQAAATILAANIDKMYARILPGSASNAVWLINQDIIPQLFALTRVVKNVAGNENVGGAPVYVPANGMAGAPFGTLLGKPIVPIEQASTLGTVGDIMLVDLKQYMLIEKGGIKADASMHVRFVYHEMAFRWTMRVNGCPIPKSAITPANGSNTVSPFIALQTRS